MKNINLMPEILCARALLAIGMMVWLIGSRAYAQMDIWVDGSAYVITNINIPRVVHHHYDGNNVTVVGNQAPTDTGPDYFLMQIPCKYTTASRVAPGTMYYNYATISAPPGTVIYDQNPVDVILGITGCVWLPDATYNSATASGDYISLTLTGTIDDIIPFVVTETITAAQFAADPKLANGAVDVTKYLPIIPTPVNVPLNQPLDITETLSIESVGRVIYNAADPNPFSGVVPEPATWPVGLAALALLAAGALRPIIRTAA